MHALERRLWEGGMPLKTTSFLCFQSIQQIKWMNVAECAAGRFAGRAMFHGEATWVPSATNPIWCHRVLYLVYFGYSEQHVSPKFHCALEFISNTASSWNVPHWVIGSYISPLKAWTIPSEFRHSVHLCIWIVIKAWHTYDQKFCTRLPNASPWYASSSPHSTLFLNIELGFQKPSWHHGLHLCIELSIVLSACNQI